MPAIERSTAVVPVHGMDTKSDASNAVPGTCELIENMHFRRNTVGGAELIKRNGGASLTRNISPSGSITTGKRLATFNDERLLIGDRLYTYSTQLAKWLDRGPSSFVAMSLEPLLSAPSVGDRPDYDIAVNGSLMCLVASSGQVTMIDLATGARLLSHVDLGLNVDLCRVVALASTFMILGSLTASGTLTAKKIDYATPTTISSGASVFIDGNTTVRWDAVRNGSNDSVMVAYRSNVPNLKIVIWNSNMTAGASASTGDDPSQAIGFFDWDASDNSLYFGYAGSVVGAKFATITTAGAISSTTVMDAALTANVRNIAGYRSGTTNTSFLEISAAATFNTLVRRWSASGASAIWQRSVGIAAKVFKVGSNYYLPATYSSPLQSSYFVLDANGATPAIVTKALYGIGGGLSTLVSSLRQCPAIDSTTNAVPVVRIIDTLPDGTTVKSGAFLRLAFGSRAVSAPKRLGESLYLAGGMIRSYDGANACSEAGFHLFPETPTLAQAGGGSLTVLGTYSYKIVYVWYDGRGQTHRSAPSAATSITLTGANATVTLTLPTLRLTEKPTIAAAAGGTVPTLFIEIYRTGNGGTTYNRLPSSNQINDVTVDSLSFNDTSSDATISSNLILYTDGGVLPHVPFPPARIVETWKGRIFAAGTENPLELWVGNELLPGDGVSVSDALVIQMEADGGAITALAELDDKLVIFKEAAIYTLTGNGPTANGDGQFDQPARLAVVTGAIDPRSIIKTRDGLMFKSVRGLHILTRGQDVVYLGAAVEAYNALTITGAAVIKDLEEVRFTTLEGRTLVYHYGLQDEKGLGRWTSFVTQIAVDAIVWNSTFVYLASDGTVTEENATYVDPGAVTYTAKVRFAWIALAQIFGRCFLYGVEMMGEFSGNFSVTMRLAYDYDATIAQSATRAVTTGQAGLLRLEPAQGHVSAVQLTLEEATTTQGFSLSATGYEAGILPGAQKLPAASYFS